MIRRMGAGTAFTKFASLEGSSRLRSDFASFSESKAPQSIGRLGLAMMLALFSISVALPSLADEYTDDEGFDVEEDGAGDGEVDFASKGFYLGGIANYAVENFDPALSLADWDNNWGASVRGGYRILPRLGLEAQAEWHEFEAVSSTPMDTWAVSANTRLYLLEGRFQPNILFGIGAMVARGQKDSSLDGEDVMMRAGVGIDIYIWQGLAFIGQADYVAALDKLSDLNYFSVGMGLQYKF